MSIPHEKSGPRELLLQVDKQPRNSPAAAAPIYCPSCHLMQPLAVAYKCASCGKPLLTPTSQLARVRPLVKGANETEAIDPAHAEPKRHIPYRDFSGPHRRRW